MCWPKDSRAPMADPGRASPPRVLVSHPKGEDCPGVLPGQTELEVPAVGNTGHGLQEDLPEPQFLEILQYVP